MTRRNLTGTQADAIFDLVWIRILPALIIPFLAAELHAGRPQEEPPPWIGTWRLDEAQSTDREESPYKRTTLRIETIDSRLRVTYDMVGTRGGRTHIEWIGALDGQDYVLQGVDALVTNAYSLVDALSYEIVVKVDDQMAAMTRVSVSADHQTLTAVTTGAGPGGEPISTTSVYRRL